MVSIQACLYKHVTSVRKRNDVASYTVPSTLKFSAAYIVCMDLTMLYSASAQCLLSLLAMDARVRQTMS